MQAFAVWASMAPDKNATYRITDMNFMWVESLGNEMHWNLLISQIWSTFIIQKRHDSLTGYALISQVNRV
jgi:hypothetical protein